MEQNLAKNYNPKDFENRIYETWEKAGAFTAERDKDKKPFTIVMPPPNITGQLHMGHALDHTLQDILTRWKRMEGYSALWLPGSDHASIATEVKVAETIKEEEGLTKEELGREAFLERAWAWKGEYGGRITEQCRKLGDSCDWSRERFTMDDGCNKAVRHYFVELYNKGLIYRGNRLINWCPECGTSLSDAEVEHEDRQGEYWYFRYPAAQGPDGAPRDIVVATSRPETMFGDVAIAVNPSDNRYKDMVGEKVILPLVGKEIPIIEDPYPDPEKGTGAVKITPAHDFNDLEVGVRAGLESPSCINEDATMNDLAGKYAGMDRYECRKAWVKDLEEAGYLEKTEEMVIPIGECYRCHTVIEPMLSDQWFVSMGELAKPAIKAIETGELEFVPKRFDKVYLRWLEEIKDWCISRQLWWGHRIPAWYCTDCGKITVSEEDVTECQHCGSKNIKQDEDVLDTWFSSALWPFSTLGWPDETPDLEYFFPTDVLVTGYDIIFFWVVRMVFSSYFALGKSPYQYVYIHGLVRDAKGRKMSKSLGNGIDPLEVIDEYGADALRFMLATGITPGNDMRFLDERILAARNFANKLWNASRFTIMNVRDEDSILDFADIDVDTESGSISNDIISKLKPEDKWILTRLMNGLQDVNAAMERFDLAMAGQKVYDLIWNEFCDWYIEFVKKRLSSQDDEDKNIARGVLLFSLKTLLKLLHPFMPFITEEIWGYLPMGQGDERPDGKAEGGLLISSTWPLFSEALVFNKEENDIELAKETIRTIRNIRAEANAPSSKKLHALIVAESSAEESFLNSREKIIEIANLTGLELKRDKNDIPDDAMTGVIPGAEIFIPLDELVDIEAEKERLTKEIKRLKGEVARSQGKLSNEGFISKAPEKLIEEERAKLKEYEDMLSKVEERLKALTSK